MLRKILIALSCAGVAFADTLIVQFTALPTTLMSPTYQSGTGSYNGYSTAIVDGIPNQDLICDDYADTTVMPSAPLIYDFSTLNANDNYLQYVEFTGTGGKTTLQLYEEAAVLAVDFAEYISAGSPNSQTITDYNYALWNLFDPAGPDPAPTTAGSVNPPSPGSVALQNAAWDTVQNNPTLTSEDAGQLVIYTPTAANPGQQEFLGVDTPTPEPPTLDMMLGIALCGLALFARRRRRKV